MRSSPRQSVSLVWLESAKEGSAPRYHLRGTETRLSALSVPVRQVIWDASDSLVARTSRVFIKSLGIPLRSRVVLARWHPLLTPLILYWRLLGCRVALLVQGTIEDSGAAHPVFNHPLIRRWAMLGLKSASVFAAPHEGISQWVTQTTNHPCQVIPNGPPIYPAHSDDEAPPLPDKYVCFAGALAPWQGIDVLVAATREPSWPQDIQLVVVGDGPMKSHLSDPGTRVAWVGHQPPTVVRQIITGSIASLSPKLMDQVTARGISPFKLLEAAQLGTPVVATSVPGQDEFIKRYQCGVLVEPGNSAALADAVARITSDSDLHASAVAGAHAATGSLSWERHAPAIKALCGL